MIDRKPQESIDELVNEFVEGIVQQSIEINRGSVKGSDVAHNRILHAFKSLTANCGDSGRDALKVLFNHSNARVRIVAASFLLRYCTYEALAVLRNEVELGEKYTSFAARCSIMNWEKGEWSLDPSGNESSKH
jgi:hypothetical protein